jgi:hypothetical protein
VSYFLISVICQLIDDNDRFFTAKMTEIEPKEFGIFAAISVIGESSGVDFINQFVTIYQLQLTTEKMPAIVYDIFYKRSCLL